MVGGRAVAQPHFSLHSASSTRQSLELSPPPGVVDLVEGDYVEATVELLTLPRAAADYYGPNNVLAKQLAAVDKKPVGSNGLAAHWELVR